MAKFLKRRDYLKSNIPTKRTRTTVKKGIYFFIIIILVVFLIIFLHRIGILAPVESLVYKVSAPIQYDLIKTGNKISDFFKAFSIALSLEKENQKLKDKVKELEVEIAFLKELETENKVLREQLGFSRREDFKLLPAEVIGVEPENFLKYLIVNKGKNNGIKKGMVVISGKGLLVGRVTEVFNTSSKVFLITDPLSAISAMVQNSRAQGIVKGQIGYQSMIMEMIPKNEEIKVGDLIITSGLGEDFPKGLVFGEVTEVFNKPNELFQKATLVSPIDFKKLETVFLILNSKK